MTSTKYSTHTIRIALGRLPPINLHIYHGRSALSSASLLETKTSSSRELSEGPALRSQCRIAVLGTDSLLGLIPRVQAHIDLVVPYQTALSHDPPLILRVVTGLQNHLGPSGKGHQGQAEVIVLYFATLREGPLLIAASVVARENT